MKKILLILAISILTGCAYPNDYDIPYNDPEAELPEILEVKKEVLEGSFFVNYREDYKAETKCLDGTDPERFYLFKSLGNTYREAHICNNQYVVYDFQPARGPIYYGPFDLETHEFIDMTPQPGVVEEKYYYSESSEKLLPYRFLTPKNEVEAILIYMHGAGGDYEQGMTDDIFEGNFARLKKYTKENGILYITPETSDFGKKGGIELIDLIKQLNLEYPVPIFLSGASAGGRTIFHTFEELDGRPTEINGFIFICPAISETQIEEFKLYPTQLPDRMRMTEPSIWIEAGEIDTIVPVERVKAFKDKLLELGFEPELNIIPGGGHDTPVNEIEWANILQAFKIMNELN